METALTMLEFKAYPPGSAEDVNLSQFALDEISSTEEILSGIEGPVDESVMEYYVNKRNAFCRLIGSRICEAVGENNQLASEIFSKLVGDIRKDAIDFAHRLSSLFEDGYFERHRTPKVEEAK